MDNETPNRNQLTVEVENHGMRYIVKFKSGRIMVYPTPVDVSQLIEIKADAKKVYQERMAELELYENNNDYVAICAENFLALARRIMSVGQGKEGYTIKITYDMANYPNIELYQHQRIDALRDQYVLKESLTIRYQSDTSGWCIQHVNYPPPKGGELLVFASTEPLVLTR